MTLIGWAQIALMLAAIVAAAIPLARYIAAVAAGRVDLLAPVERAIFAAGGIDPARGMGWRGYTLAMLAANAARALRCCIRCCGCRRAAAEPAGLRRALALARVQHRGLLRHQHQLAGVQRASPR